MKKILLKKKKAYLFVFVMILLAVNNLQTVPMPENYESGEYEIAKVIRVVDGDTLLVEVAGVEERVRLIGVDAPESAGKYKNNPEPGGAAAAEYVKYLLPEGTEICMTADAGDRDRYERLLRYVWLEAPDPSVSVDLDEMLNAQLLAKGFAEIMEVPPNVRFADEFKETKLGKWK